jgi:hypothetical protein
MLRKFATATILEARRWDDTRRTAHRASFLYVPREGFLYVRSRAISSRTNDNFDNFPAEEIEKSWRSFIGKPVFVNHHNSDHRRARGVIIDAALHHDQNPDGSPDTWVELLHEVDARRFPKLAEAILNGWVERTSMGCDVAFSICSACGNKASTPMDYCRHIPSMKGQKIRRKNASTGSTEDVLVYEKCYGLGFFENSLLVEDPADPTAWLVGVDDRGVGGGYTGSLLAFNDPDLTPGLSLPDGADHRSGYAEAGSDLTQRELATLGSTTAKRNLGQQVPLDDEDISLDELRRVVAATNVAASSGHHVSGVVGGGAQDPVVRPMAQRDVARVAHHHAVGDRADQMLVAPPVRANRAAPGIRQREATVATPSKGASRPQPAPVRGGRAVDLGQVPLHLGHAVESTRLQRTADVNPVSLIETLPHAGGFTVSTHGENVPNEGYMVALPDKEMQVPLDTFGAADIVWYVGHHAEDLRPAHRFLGGWLHHQIVYLDTSNWDPDLQDALRLGAQWHQLAIFDLGHMAEIPVSNDLAFAAAAEGDRVRFFIDVDPADFNEHEIHHYIRSLKGYRSASKAPLEKRASMARTTAEPMHHHAYGETMAPAQVSTIRDDACPVCGDTDGFNGERCQTCAYFRPPGEFMDPDLTKAKSVDLRQGNEESGEIDADGDTDNVFDLDQPGDADGALGAPQVGADGQPVAPEVATVDENGKPLAADGAEVKLDENGDPIVPSDPLVGGENAAPGDPTDPDGKVLDHDDPNVVDPKAKTDGTVNANPSPVGTDPRAEVVKVPTRTESPLPDPHPRAPQPGQGPRLKGDTFELTKPVEQPAAPAEEVKAPAPAKDEAPDTAPKAKSDKDDDDEDSDEDDPKSKKKTNPFTKKTSRNGREADDMRPTLRALAEQQIRQDAQDKKIRLIANVAGLDFGTIDREAAQRIARLRRQADTENPAQPVENPGPEAPSESSAEALAPEAKADVESVGTAGATDVAPEATVDVEAVGTSVPVESTDTLDVEKPVSGIELAENDSETSGDVTSQGLNADTAFEINPGFAKGSSVETKVYASIRLARLRQQANIADPSVDDLSLGSHIASSMTIEQINAEIKTLDAVTRTAARQPRPMGAGGTTPPQIRETRRSMPSLTAAAQGGHTHSIAPAAGPEIDDALMFLD